MTPAPRARQPLQALQARRLIRSADLATFRHALVTLARDRAPGEKTPPFTIRPGLIAAMLDFYDELGRRGRTVRRFAGALFKALRGHLELEDQGSHDLIRQTVFLALTFREYRRSVRAA